MSVVNIGDIDRDNFESSAMTVSRSQNTSGGSGAFVDPVAKADAIDYAYHKELYRSGRLSEEEYRQYLGIAPVNPEPVNEANIGALLALLGIPNDPQSIEVAKLKLANLLTGSSAPSNNTEELLDNTVDVDYVDPDMEEAINATGSISGNTSTFQTKPKGMPHRFRTTDIVNELNTPVDSAEVDSKLLREIMMNDVGM